MAGIWARPRAATTNNEDMNENKDKTKKIICIGECALDVVFGPDGTPLGSMPGGRLANAAALLAREGLPVVMAAEAAADAVGDTVVAFLADSGVDTCNIDRFTEGRTPILSIRNGTKRYTRLQIPQKTQ